MNQTRLKNQKVIKVMPEEQNASVLGTVMVGEQQALPPNCYIVPMTILKTPIPLRKGKKKAR